MPLRFVLAAACVGLALGCSDDSPQAHLDQLKADVEIVCWQYNGCANGGMGPASSPPDVAIEQGVSCMNDALASGARAMSSWAVDNFEQATHSEEFVFTVDHQVKELATTQSGPGAPKVLEAPPCAGPVVINDYPICYANSAGSAVPVKTLASGGCP